MEQHHAFRGQKMEEKLKKLHQFLSLLKYTHPSQEQLIEV